MTTLEKRPSFREEYTTCQSMEGGRRSTREPRDSSTSSRNERKLSKKDAIRSDAGRPETTRMETLSGQDVIRDHQKDRVVGNRQPYCERVKIYGERLHRAFPNDENKKTYSKDDNKKTLLNDENKKKARASSNPRPAECDPSDNKTPRVPPSSLQSSSGRQSPSASRTVGAQTSDEPNFPIRPGADETPKERRHLAGAALLRIEGSNSREASFSRGVELSSRGIRSSSLDRHQTGDAEKKIQNVLKYDKGPPVCVCSAAPYYERERVNIEKKKAQMKEVCSPVISVIALPHHASYHLCCIRRKIFLWRL